MKNIGIPHRFLTIMIPLFVFFSTSDSLKDEINLQNTPLDGKGGGIIAYSVTHADGTNQIYMMNADGSGKKQISNMEGRPCGPDWSPDGSMFAFYNHINDKTWSLFTMNSDGGNVKRLTNEQDALHAFPRWSPDGKKILFTKSFSTPVWRSELWTILPDGSNQTRIGNVDGQGGDYSPDGSKIAYFNYIDGGGDIWLIDSDGRNVRQLTNHAAEDWWPVWSPDGKRIVFQSKRDGNFEIYVMNSDGSNPVRLTDNDIDDEEPKWSPDGTKIAFLSMRDGHYEIYIMNSDGTGQKRLTNENGHAINPDWKPVRE
jgi:TolB protein